MRGFAELPAQIAAFTREHERCAFVLLDAFGWAFVERHAAHPFLQRLKIEPVASQFPSTTTAHLTTLYSGLPVEEHGLYEWRIFEPNGRGGDPAAALRSRARRGPAAHRRPARTCCPPMGFFASLDVPVTVLHPHAIAHTPYGSVAHAGTTMVGYERIEEAVALLGANPGLTYLYWDRIDSVGHKHGPWLGRVPAHAACAGWTRSTDFDRPAADLRRPRPDRRHGHRRSAGASGPSSRATSRSIPRAPRATCSCTWTIPRTW